MTNLDLHLFQTREGYWRVRIDGLPGGREYTMPHTTVRSVLLVVAQRINVELPPSERA